MLTFPVADSTPAEAPSSWRAWPGVGRRGRRWAVLRMRRWPARPRGRLRQWRLACACLRCHRANRSPTGSGSVALEREPASSCHSPAPGPARLVALTGPASDTTMDGCGFASESAVPTPDRWFRSRRASPPPPLRRCRTPLTARRTQPHLPPRKARLTRYSSRAHGDTAAARTELVPFRWVLPLTAANVTNAARGRVNWTVGSLASVLLGLMWLLATVATGPGTAPRTAYRRLTGSRVASQRWSASTLGRA